MEEVCLHTKCTPKSFNNVIQEAAPEKLFPID